jgi:hypothetical protein
MGRNRAPSSATPAQRSAAGRSAAAAPQRSETAAAAQALAQRMGNRGFAQWMAKSQGMAHHFGLAPDAVPVHADAAAAGRARALGARGFTDGHAIGLADAAPADAQRTLAHEYAHVAQQRGGNVATAWPVRTRERAERQAEHAAAAVLGARRPQVGAYRADGLLLDGPAPKRTAAGRYTFTVPQVRQWKAAGKNVLYQMYRVHVLNLYPGATEQDVSACLATLGDLYYTGNLENDLKRSEAKNAGKMPVVIMPTLHARIQAWLKKNKSADVPDLDQSKSGSPDGKTDGDGGGGEGSGSGAGKGTGSGSGSGGGDAAQLGLSKDAPQKVDAPDLDAAVDKVKQDIDAAKAVKAKGADGKDHIWPAEVSDPEQRKAILQVMKDIVGEPMKLPEDKPSDVPPRLGSDEAAFLLKIALSDEKTRASIIAKLKGDGGELKGSSGQTLAQTLDTAIANVELDKHAGELGLSIDKAKPSDDPSKQPIENRPVHGRIVNLSGALSPGERAVWKFRVEDDRDAFRVPVIYIAWAAFKQGKDGSTGEKVSSENTMHIPVRDQGLLNDSEFDFTVRETGTYIVKAIVNHNFFRPAYFEEPFVVEEEFAQSDREFKEGHGDIVKSDRGWDAEMYDHGGDFDYRLGRMRTGVLKDDVHATSNAELIESIEKQKKAVKDSIDALIKADPSRKEDLEDAYNDRAAEFDKQIDKIKEKGGSHPLVVRGQFVSRVRDVEDATMNLACTLDEVDSPDGKSTWFHLYLHDATTRANSKVNHFESGPVASVQAAERDLFLQIAEAYPFGTVNVLFQGYDYSKHAPTQNFVQFQKKTDTVGKDIKSVVFDETVDTLVNVVGFVLTLFPLTTAVGITLLVAYNTSKAISENLDDYETGNFEKRKAGIAVADLVINLLPLAPRIVKVGKVAYYVIKGASIGGTVLLMSVVGLESVRQLRNGNIDALARKQQEYEKLKKDNPANPLIANGTLLAEIEKLKKQTGDATVDVFSQLAAQAVFMHVVSTSVEQGLTGLKSGGPVETKLLPGARDRSAAIGGLEEAGGFKHVDGAKPSYDYGTGKITADGNAVKPNEFNPVRNEMVADNAMKEIGLAPAERAKAGPEIAKAGAEVRKGLTTQVITAADGHLVVIVGEHATAAEIHAALRDYKAPEGVKPKPPPPKSFVPVEKPPLGTAPERLGKIVNGQLSETARAKLGPVGVEIVPEGSFGPGKTRAQVVHVDGKTILRFEGEPRPGVMAEEVAHLEQLADPQFKEQTKILAEAAGKDWSTFSDAKKVEAHKARLVLEIEAQKSVIEQLTAGAAGKEPGALAIEVADVDAAYQNLEQLRHKLGETISLAEEVKAGALSDRPDFIDDRPTLTNRKTTNKYPLPPDWSKMNQKDFIKKYRETYPDTTLTDSELRERHRNGMRLNPETGRLKDPTLVDNPTPDIPAIKENPESVPVEDLKLSKAEKKRMQELLDARDKARRARDAALGRGDEEAAAAKARDVNEASRQLGEAHADAYMEEHFPEFEKLYPGDAAKPSRAGDFDQVWIKYGKSKSGKKVVVQVIVIEAKGGTSPLGTRKAGGLVVQQGTGAYFESIVASMEKGTPEMAKVAAIIRDLKPADIEYKLVRTPIAMTPGAKPRSQVLAIEIADFNLAKTLKK